MDNIEQPSVKAFLKQQGTWDSKFNKVGGGEKGGWEDRRRRSVQENEEYLEALNKQEVAEKELHGSKSQYERAAKIAEAYKRRSDRLSELYEKQDRLLGQLISFP